MALLGPDDVLNKSFQTTKFRDGYDQDEVDDFLDEVVNSMRAVYAENDELKAKLAAAEERIAQLSRAEGAPVPEPEAPAPVPPSAPSAPSAPPAAPPAAAQGAAPESATGMLALAQRLHDEYVRDGREEGDRIIADARAEAATIVRDAESQRESTLKQLENERGSLERKIDELRNFERDYRQRLKSYLESLLTNVDSSNPSASADF